MIITHASHEKIKKVSSQLDCPLRGCLFFGYEGNTYNLTQCNFQYDLEINEDNIIRATRFFYEHLEDEPEVLDVLEIMRSEVFAPFDDMSNEQLCELLDETENTNELEAEAAWLVRQYQGILAHKLGYDACESFDEQGVVFIAYCVGRELKEVVA